MMEMLPRNGGQEKSKEDFKSFSEDSSNQKAASKIEEVKSLENLNLLPADEKSEDHHSQGFA